LLPCKTNIGYSFQHMYICYTGRYLFVILNNKRKLNSRPRLRFARYVWSLWYKYYTCYANTLNMKYKHVHISYKVELVNQMYKSCLHTQTHSVKESN